MESMDNFRERIEALEQQMKVMGAHTRTAARRLRWWRGIACGVLLLSLVSLAPPSQATDFSCTAGDVACLIDAINQGNVNGAANTITLEAGTYTLTAVDNNTDGPNGLPSITSPLTIQGDGAATTILERASGAPAFRLVHVAASGHLRLTKTSLRNGGIEVGGPAVNGAGLFNNGGTVHLVRTTVTQNNAGRLDGGGLLTTGGTVHITHSRFTNNEGFVGGGLNATGGTVIITQSTVAGNDADFGGGMVILPQAVVLVVDTTVLENTAHGPSGGGIANQGLLQIMNSTVARNIALADGAGLSNSGTTVILNVTIADNMGVFGASGISAARGVTVQNTILRNTFNCFGTVTSLGNNLISRSTLPLFCTITLQDTDLIADPGLDAFTDNGRPGKGHFPLLPTSPAIDAGSDAVCPRTDQLGKRRIGPCDIGAIRFLDEDDRRHEEEDDQHDEDPATTVQESQ